MMTILVTCSENLWFMEDQQKVEDFLNLFVQFSRFIYNPNLMLSLNEICSRDWKSDLGQLFNWTLKPENAVPTILLTAQKKTNHHWQCPTLQVYHLSVYTVEMGYSGFSGDRSNSTVM